MASHEEKEKKPIYKKGWFWVIAIIAIIIIVASQNTNIGVSSNKNNDGTTIEERNALIKANEYSMTMHMSKKGIYEQLTSEYGEKFSENAAQYAIDNMRVDFKANALEKAKNYQNMMNMSKSAIYDQLVSPTGEQFTEEEAQYAIDNLED